MISINKKYFVFAGIIIFLTFAVIYIIMPRGKPVEVTNNNELFSVVKEGDIICRLGDRFWSQVFKDYSVTDKRYSHMGIIHIEDGQINVIHSEGTTEPGKDYVKQESLDDFIKIARSIGIYRLNETDGNTIAASALQYIGFPFDWKFDFEDEAKIYCTELLYHVLKQTSPDIKLETTYIKELGRDIITLEAISAAPERFFEVYSTTPAAQTP